MGSTTRWVLGAWLSASLLAVASGFAQDVVWDAHDDRPIPEPAEDPTGDYIWWDGAYSMTLYQIGKVANLNDSLHWIGERIGIAGPREALNVNALDEVPSSTWFTNRHALRRMSPAELSRGPNFGPPPSEGGILRIISGKGLGTTPGFLIEDDEGRRYIVKFDSPEVPEMATGTEIVCSKILYALGWNVPEYHLIDLDPRRLRLADDASIKTYLNRKRPMTDAEINEILSKTARNADGTHRAVASRFIPGKPKGPFRTTGTRPDDANDIVRHEDRRDLRGLRIPAAWINYTDARRGNFYDTFIEHPDDPEGRGHLVHYILDFSSALGSGNTEWKPPSLGNEYVFDPPILLKSLFSLGLCAKPWEDVEPVQQEPLGYFPTVYFDPEEWKTSYPQPLFDGLTARDEFWGAKLIYSLTTEDLRRLADTGRWSDPRTTDVLVDALLSRRRAIAEAYFRHDRINPTDGFRIEGDALVFEDLAAKAGLVGIGEGAYSVRTSKGEEVRSFEPRIRLPAGSLRLELRASPDGGKRWSPATWIEVRQTERGRQIVAVERETATAR